MLARKDHVFGLYLHIPFCKKKCAYCDFASGPFDHEEELLAAYAQSLGAQMQELLACPIMDELQTAYIGGGTPTVLGSYLPLLAQTLSAQTKLIEFSCEANPESTTFELLQSLKEAGVSRMSFGVQSLDAAELRALGRIHSPQQAIRALQAAHKLGFRVSADLMCAIPLQTASSWEKSLAGCVACGIDHISVYPLTIEPHTAFWKRYACEDEPAFNSDEVQAQRMEFARDFLEAHAFTRYEVASYARAGASCKHNLCYWEGKNYLGLGTHASSMLSRACYRALRLMHPKFPQIDEDIVRVRFANTDNRSYLVAHPRFADAHFDFEFMTQRQAMAEDLMLAARTTTGLSCELLGAARDTFGAEAIDRIIDDCMALGLVEERESYVAPSNKGWLLGNYLFEKFWDLAGTDPATASM